MGRGRKAQGGGFHAFSGMSYVSLLLQIASATLSLTATLMALTVSSICLESKVALPPLAVSPSTASLIIVDTVQVFHYDLTAFLTTFSVVMSLCSVTLSPMPIRLNVAANFRQPGGYPQ